MMKKLLVLFTAAVAACGSLFAEQLDHWVYDAAAKTVSDGVWTLSVSIPAAHVDGKWTSDVDIVGITVGNPVENGYPADTDPQELNFAKPVVKSTDETQTVNVMFISNFHTANVAVGNGNSTTPLPWAGSVRRVVFPPTGACRFHSLHDGAFAWTTNLVEVVNFLPDEITTLGIASFRYSSISQDLFLRGVVNQTGAHVFGDSRITSVTFGPGLKVLGGGNQWGYKGSFASPCLTNVTFDANMHDARMSGYDLFQTAPLDHLPDLSGFNDLRARGVFRDCGLTVETLTVHAGVTNFHGSFMWGLNTKTLVFEGLPPDEVGGGSLNNGAVLTTYVPEEYKNEWAKWTDGGKPVDGATTTWCQSVAGNNYAKYPLIYKAKAGDLGDWVYNTESATISDGTWIFNATLDSPTQVAVCKCIHHPDVPSELDFTGSVSDQNGFPMTIVRLNTGFGESNGAWNAGMGPSVQTESAPFVSSLVIPESVNTINSRAFACCCNLTKVTPFLPDTVKTIELSAFYKTAVTGEVRLPGIKVVNNAIFYGCTNLTSAVLGPLFSSFNCSRYGSFGNCTSLTNFVFDPAMEKFSVNDYGSVFEGSTAFGGTFDFSKCTGFSTGGNVSENCFSGTSITNLILGASLSSISSTTLSGMNSLQSVEFLGAPPKAMKTPVYKGERVIVTCVHKAFKSDWAQYVDGGAFTSRKAFWSPDFIDVDKTLRPFLVVDQVDGLMMIIK